jgi:two-component system cell cycle sensor histidine kinase/response regulator CckA
MLRAIAAGDKQMLRTRVVRPDGTVRHLQVSAMLVPDSESAASRLVGTALEVTADVHAEEERVRIDAPMPQAQKLESLGILAGGIAHDSNNLLVGILGNASLALLELDAPSPVRDCLQEIERASQKAAELTRQLLASAGKGRYLVDPVDPSSTIQDVGSLLRSAVSRSASLQFDLPTTIPPIEVDVNQFCQVVMTLVTSAPDALTERQGVISVLTGRQEVTAEYLGACMPGTTATPGPMCSSKCTTRGPAWMSRPASACSSRSSPPSSPALASRPRSASCAATAAPFACTAKWARARR